MTQKYTYNEYIKIRAENLKNNVTKLLTYIDNVDDKENLIEDSIFEYSKIIYQKIDELYRSQNMILEPYEYEKNIYKIKNPTVKNKLEILLTDLNLSKTLFASNDNNQDEIKIEELLNNFGNESKQKIITTLQKYQNEYNDTIKFLGSGGSCTAYEIGNKVIKFGNIRRYKNIPFCLDIDDIVKCDEYKYMYITDKLSLSNISENDVQNIYNSLRNYGFVWTDAKDDNIGRKNNQLMILDDIDIYSTEEILKNNNFSILEFLSKCNIESVIREIRWMKQKNENFNIDEIDKLFSNQSSQTLEHINLIKQEYLKRTKTYEYDNNTNELPLFIELLKESINNYYLENNMSHKKQV